MAVEFEAIAPVLFVRDVIASANYFEEKLGFESSLYHEPPDFAIVSRGAVKLMFVKLDAEKALIPNWRVAPSTNDAYIWVSDAKTLYDELCANGTHIDYTLYDTPWGTREFGIQDLDEHDITFGQVIR